MFLCFACFPTLNGCGDEACNAIAITTEALPNGKVGQKYTAEIKSSCPNSKFVVFSGTLPPGISLSEKGKLDGTPTVAGNFGFTVKNYQSQSNSVTEGEIDARRLLSITIAP
jgi:hypothetical protein